MTRMQPKYSTEDPVLNLFRMLGAVAEPITKDGQFVGLIVPEKMRDYSPPREKDIAGYHGDAEMLCPDCVHAAYAQEGESTRQALDRVARELGIDRSDERNYDSSQLPKPIALKEFDCPQSCGSCFKLFGPDPAEFRRCPDDDCDRWVTGSEGPGTCTNCWKTYDDEDFENIEEA